MSFSSNRQPGGIDMKAKTSFSTLSDPALAAAALAGEIGDGDNRLVVYFASSQYEPVTLAREMAAAFPGVTLFGCTTAGEIVTGQMLDKSIVAMALGSELVKNVHIVVAEGISSDGRGATKGAILSLEAMLRSKLVELDSEKFAGLILCDGLAGAEEAVMDEIGNAGNLTFVGGSAGDDLQFKKTHIFVNDRAYSDVAAIALIEMAVPFRAIKTQSFRVLDKALVATKVDEHRREVLEFNGKPAAHAYADALGVPVSALSGQFMRYPLGLLAEGEPFVRSPQAVDGTKIRFYCQILEGMVMQVLESTDIVADTRRDISNLGAASALLNFNCILRTLELKDKGQCSAYAGLFNSVPTVGFSTYGEAYIGHINQTATILVIGS
jgi:hypothetical protein